MGLQGTVRHKEHSSLPCTPMKKPYPSSQVNSSHIEVPLNRTSYLDDVVRNSTFFGEGDITNIDLVQRQNGVYLVVISKEPYDRSEDGIMLRSDVYGYSHRQYQSDSTMGEAVKEVALSCYLKKGQTILEKSLDDLWHQHEHTLDNPYKTPSFDGNFRALLRYQGEEGNYFLAFYSASDEIAPRYLVVGKNGNPNDWRVLSLKSDNSPPCPLEISAAKQDFAKIIGELGHSEFLLADSFTLWGKTYRIGHLN